MTLVFKVNGVDLGPGGAGIVQGLEPQGAGIAYRIGTATGVLQATGGGGYAILPMMPVQAYDLSVDQAVQFLAITAAGTGYTSPPAVSIAAPPAGGTPATAHALVSGGHVTNLVMDSFGSGYLATPAVTITGGGGSGATATATISHYLPAVYFGGYVNRPASERLEGSQEKLWNVDLQDYNLQFKRLVGGAAWPGIAVPAGTLPSQVAFIVNALQAGPPAPTTLIDATSQVADILNGVTLPAVTFQGKSLGNMLLALAATAQALVPAVRPQFCLAPDYTVGPGRWSFGGPVLYLYDGAQLPAPVQSYNDVPSLGQQTILSTTPYQRTLDGTDLVDWRESIVQGAPQIFIGYVPDAIATYPNECDPLGAWHDEPLNDTTSNSGHGAAGTAVLGTGVGGVAVNAGGTGYTSAPAVGFSGGGGTGAAGTAVLTQGLGTVAVGAGGSGYSVAPLVSFPNGNGRDATGTLQVNGHGTIMGVLITAGGTGYLQAPIIDFGPTGTGAAGTAILDSSGHITGVSLQNGGSGYPAGQAVTFTGVGLGGGATATATVGSGRVTGVTITARGTGYSSVPDVVFTPVSGGTGATATATLTGLVASVTMTETGTGYTGVPTVSFSGGGGTGALGTASTSPGVASVTVTAGGLDYNLVVQVTFTGGGGSGASGTATLSNGQVVSVTMTHHGSGYSTPPTPVFTGLGSISGQAQALIDATVAATAYPRESLEIWSDAVPGMAPPLPGQTVRVSLSLENLVNVIYQVAATRHTFLMRADGTLLCRYGLTLGLPQLQLGEYPHIGSTAPIVTVPPGEPAAFALISNSFNGLTGATDLTFTWTASTDPTVDGYRLRWTFGGVAQPDLFIAGRLTASTVLSVVPGGAFTATLASHAPPARYSLDVGPLAGNSAPRFNPDPPTTLSILSRGISEHNQWWAVIGWTPPASIANGPHDWYDFWWAPHSGASLPIPIGAKSERILGTDTSTFLGRLTPGVVYDVWIRSVSNTNWVGPASSPILHVSQLLGPPAPPPSGMSTPDAPIAGWVPSDLAVITIDPTVSRETSAAWKFAPAVSTAPHLDCLPLPASQDQAFGMYFSYQRNAGVAPVTTVAWQWWDGPGGTGTNFHTDTDTLPTATTSWQRYTQNRTAPAGTASLVVIITTALGGSAGVLWIDAPGPPHRATLAADYAPASVTLPALNLQTDGSNILGIKDITGLHIVGQIWANYNGSGGVDFFNLVANRQTGDSVVLQLQAFNGIGFYAGENGSTTNGGDVRANADTGKTIRFSFNGADRATLSDTAGWNFGAAERHAYRLITAARTLDATDRCVDCDTTTASYAVTLPPASTGAGLTYEATKIDSSAHKATLTAAGSDTINGAAAFALSTQYASATVRSNGVSAWYIVASH